MMIYVDDARITRTIGRHRKARWSHLVAIPEDDHLLSDFAKSIGLNPAWLQRSTIAHFDVTETMRRRALVNGARAISQREMIQLIRDARRAN